MALRDPDTALRVARRAEHMIQACVGLSPNRRAQAIKLVSTKQRDPAADPRIRVAACRLALELESSDLPAWAESCKWLSDPKNQSIDRFAEFINFAPSQIDREQMAQQYVDPLVTILETSTNDKVRQALCGVLFQPVRRLEPAQVQRVADALAAILKKSTDEDVLVGASRGLKALAPRLEPAQRTRAWDALIAVQQRPMGLSVDNSATDGLTARCAVPGTSTVEACHGCPDQGAGEINGRGLALCGEPRISGRSAEPRTSTGQACLGRRDRDS